jgi:hypothetical protein
MILDGVLPLTKRHIGGSFNDAGAALCRVFEMTVSVGDSDVHVL